MITQRRRLVLMRRLGSQRAAQRLQDQRNDITGNKQARVSLGTDAGILFPESVHDASEAQVDAAGHEGRRDRQADNLKEEADFVPWVGPGEDAADVAEDLEGAAGC